jgi:autophagy-related protein 9
MYSLKTRFIFMGVMNAILAPFIVIYLLLYSFFRYFDVSLTEQPTMYNNTLTFM